MFAVPDFPGVGQTFVIERHVSSQKIGKKTFELACGITSHTPGSADAERALALNRNNWAIESCHYILALELGRGTLGN